MPEMPGLEYQLGLVLQCVIMETNLVINLITVDEAEICVGATDSERWGWDIADGESGADARTMVWVTLKDNGVGYVASESAGFFCHREDPLRKLAYDGIPGLFNIAWDIRERKLTQQEAREAYFGFEIKRKEH